MFAAKTIFCPNESSSSSRTATFETLMSADSVEAESGERLAVKADGGARAGSPARVEHTVLNGAVAPLK